MNTSVVELGSNIDPEANITEAKRLIAQQHELLKESEFRRTKPIGFPDQPDFLNGAVLIRTKMDKDLFKQFLQHIERALGRQRMAFKYAPRTIDLDIIVWNGKIVDNEFYLRDFTREAVLELIPDLEYDHTI